MTLRGWRAYGAAFLAGALAALAMPPLYWLPLAVLGVVAFVWLWQTAPGPKSALLRGWTWGIGHFAVGSYWIVEAFFVPPPTTQRSACRSWRAWRCSSASSRALRQASRAG
jgi:apolipoprotein N-acyltransferase